MSGHAQHWNTVALAGTQPILNGVEPTEWSVKNKEEQDIVAEYVRKIVKKHGRKMTEKGPYTARAGQLVHLKTDFLFQLKETGFGAFYPSTHRIYEELIDFSHCFRTNINIKDFIFVHK